MAVTVTQKDTKEAGGAVPSHKRRRMQSIREEAMYCVVQAVYPHTHTRTHAHSWLSLTTRFSLDILEPLKVCVNVFMLSS